MKLSDFDYTLPNELIARYPAERREGSRMLVLHRDSETFEDRMFAEFPSYVRTGDLLVLNNTRVIPARLKGIRVSTGAEIEIFLLRELTRENAQSVEWQVLARPAKKVKVGERIQFSDELIGEVLEEQDDGMRMMRLVTTSRSFDAVLSDVGHTPLPPYLDREDEPIDRERYQTVYARVSGAVAAPTAGLHFTEAMLSDLESMGVSQEYILLHTGLGTFRPVEVETIEDHHMHEEYYEVSAESAQTIKRTKANGGRIIAVGTTTVRTLESSAAATGEVIAGSGYSNLFIYPPYRFKVPDVMLTNFHMPKSTLLMMLSAFAGREFILRCYEHAVKERYRFFSYGDAMLIL